jgi:hypothetical protein
MDAAVLISLARNHLDGDAPGLKNLWISKRALALQWLPRRGRGETGAPWWIFLLNPAPELWRLEDGDEAIKLLKAEARPDASRGWAQELKGARLTAVQGDPRERWLGLLFQRRAVTGRLECARLAYQAFPGRAGLRLDPVGPEGQPLDPSGGRLGLGSPFPFTMPVAESEPPAFGRLRERLGDRLEAALAGHLPDLLPGEGDLSRRHRTWSLERAAKLLVAPSRLREEKQRTEEKRRLVRLGEALERDRLRHAAALPLKGLGAELSAELYRLKGATGRVCLLNGSEVDLPEGCTAETAVQRWFSAGKKAERGLVRVAELERDRMRQLEAPSQVPAEPERKPKGKKVMKERIEKRPLDQRSDGKGKAFRSLQVDNFEVLIGKGDADNDRLTFKVAAGADFWLHVAGVPGSHVVIRNPDKVGEPPREVLERAAQLAAWHSKARDGGKVEVHWCRVADISKPRGFAPGKVILKAFKSLRVYPKE